MKLTEDFAATDMIWRRPQKFLLVAKKVEQSCLRNLWHHIYGNSNFIFGMRTLITILITCTKFH